MSKTWGGGVPTLRLLLATCIYVSFIDIDIIQTLNKNVGVINALSSNTLL